MKAINILWILVAASPLIGCGPSNRDSPLPLRPGGVCNQELTDALRAGQAATVRELIVRHVQVRCFEPASGATKVRPWTTPLELAVASGQPELVRLLISAGADAGDDKREITAIYRAVRMRRLDLVTMLIDAGASPNSHSGNPLLREAILQGDQPIVSALLDRGANPNQRWFSELQPGGTAYDPETFEKCAITPLMEVAARGASQLVKPLLRANADRRQVDCMGQSALDYARRNSHNDVVQLLSR